MVRQSRSLLYLLLLSGVLHLSAIYFVRMPVTKSRANEYFQTNMSLRLQEVRESRDESRNEKSAEIHSTAPPQPSASTAPVKPPVKKDNAAASVTPARPKSVPNLSVPVISAESEKSAEKSTTADELSLSSEQVTTQKLDKALATEDILSNAKRSVGKIDKDLRAEVVAPARAAMMGREGPSKLAQAIAKAGIPRTMQGEVVYGAGGQQFTKYTGPNGTFCLSVLKAERMFGQARMEEPGVRVTNCPN